MIVVRPPRPNPVRTIYDAEDPRRVCAAIQELVAQIADLRAQLAALRTEIDRDRHAGYPGYD